MKWLLSHITHTLGLFWWDSHFFIFKLLIPMIKGNLKFKQIPKLMEKNYRAKQLYANWEEPEEEMEVDEQIEEDHSDVEVVSVADHGNEEIVAVDEVPADGNDVAQLLNRIEFHAAMSPEEVEGAFNALFAVYDHFLELHGDIDEGVRDLIEGQRRQMEVAARREAQENADRQGLAEIGGALVHEDEEQLGVAVEKQKKLTDLPDELLLEILLMLDSGKAEEMRLMSHQLDAIFASYGNLFEFKNIPEKNSMALSTYWRFGRQVVELEMSRPVGATSKKIIITDPTFSTVKRYLNISYNVHTQFEGSIPSFMEYGTEKRGQLKKHLEKCNVKSLTIFESNWEGSHIENISDLFSTVPTLKLHARADQLPVANEAIMNKVQSLIIFDEASKDLAQEILKSKSIELMIIYVEKFFPIDQYIEEWKNGDRDIENWKFCCLEGDDFEFNMPDQTFERSDETRLELASERTDDGELRVIDLNQQIQFF